MIDNHARKLVLGGWACAPDLLGPVFGGDAIYVDANRMMPLLVDGRTLRPDWIDRAAEQISRHASGPELTLAGWSTGALIAFAIADRIGAARCVLLSATPSFCRREAFPHGQPCSVVRAMVRRIATDQAGVLAQFFSRAGLAGALSGVPRYEPGELAAGLFFLEQVNLFPVSPISAPSLFLHGRDDPIIPAPAGRLFASMTGARYEETAGGHAFFLDNPADTGRIIAQWRNTIS